jgi:hypothetical protein
MLWLFVVLKIPILTLCWLVWWAIKQEPEPTDVPESGDGGLKIRPHPSKPLPRKPRRGPHGGEVLAPPPRVRHTVHARARSSTH